MKYIITLLVCLSLSTSAKSNDVTLTNTVKKEIFSELSKHHFIFQVADKAKRKVTHKILMQKKINDSFYILAGSFRKKYECHVCGVKLSLFVYKRLSNTWKLYNKIIDFIEYGSWGVAPSKKHLDIVQIGKNEYALQIKGGGGGQGYFEDTIHLFHVVQKGVKDLGNFTTHANDGGTMSPSTDWDATFSIIPSNKAFYTIKMHKKGLVEGKKINVIHRYEYNHKKHKYRLDKSQKKL